jgi:ABC-type bacteriocin/lantibiotic exporter with double-glycine peptidase domain
MVQEAWVQNTSIRNNILMCGTFDAARYKAVLTACALDEDLAAMPAGDATEIGEKGVTLSGPQLTLCIIQSGLGYPNYVDAKPKPNRS